VWSATGIRGVEATSAHAVVRLAFDQTAENVTGVGAPPATWPLRERTVDYALKGIYALITVHVTVWKSTRVPSRCMTARSISGWRRAISSR
jgi:hypothetical protein